MKKNHNIKKPCIFGVALGPGDPDLITVKGLDILKTVDVIYYPGALFSSGRKSSYALSIMEQYDLDLQKCKGFYLAMNLDRTAAELTYSNAFEYILSDYKAGRSIAIVSEGDISTYSSFAYLLRRIKKHHLEVELVPGISSYSLAAAQQQIPLCLQDEPLIILPRVQDKGILEEALAAFSCLVLMKIKSSIGLIQEVLSQHENAEIYYFERLGTAQQFMSTNWNEIMNRDIPYFSLIIVRI
ncbi:precorrin-2 C(20)-methyltransferase [Aureispira anguillae]|uniref:Precorrin-2 C(20)-methyltransferase n=1 Tax=Aureispira anguillae TaxID=2864201 RepID=A0A915YDS7_9BACT|nr:precorrin-2 C(20)-methyltransferase [Aureispira anguillae]BDS11205.1 precorrin-2 C(20)-methyltransferase [Aureispira anguillae]